MKLPICTIAGILVAASSIPPVSMRVRYCSRAFSLVEILTAISIIALLAALLFPAMGRLKQASLATKCSSNLRQLYVASQGYSADNNGRIVPAFYPGEGKAGSLANYTGLLASYLGRNSTNEFTSAADLPVAVCPVRPAMFGYGHNYGYLSYIQTGVIERWVTLGSVASPSKTVFLCDSENSGDLSGSFLSWHAYVRRPGSSAKDYVPSFRHPGNTANVLWLDGHVSAEKKDGEWMNGNDSYWDTK